MLITSSNSLKYDLSYRGIIDKEKEKYDLAVSKDYLCLLLKRYDLHNGNLLAFFYIICRKDFKKSKRQQY